MKKNFIIPIILFFSVIFFAISFYLTKNTAPPVSPKSIPVPQDFVTNPALQQLNTNIKGTVVEVNSQSFILEGNGKRVTLYYEPNGISTFTLKEGSKDMPYDQLVIRDYLEGGVSIIVSPENAVGLTGDRKPGDIIAHFFTVTKR